MSRLSKPVSFIILTCIGTSASISYLLLSQELSEEAIREFLFPWGQTIFGQNNYLNLSIDLLSAKVLSFLSTLIFVSMIFLHKIIQHKNGYVKFFILAGLLSSVILFLPISSYVRGGA